MAKRVHFTDKAAAERAMGSLHASGRISTWTGKQTSAGFSVRYLTACRRAWFDLLQCDMDRFFPVAAGARA